MNVILEKSGGKKETRSTEHADMSLGELPFDWLITEAMMLLTDQDLQNCDRANMQVTHFEGSDHGSIIVPCSRKRFGDTPSTYFVGMRNLVNLRLVRCDH